MGAATKGFGFDGGNQPTAVKSQDLGIYLELSEMVDDGLLELGVGADGEVIFWPTERGIIELGMVPSSS